MGAEGGDVATTAPLVGASGDGGWRSVRESEGLELARGAALDRFVLLDVLGQGGMGVVLAAYDPVLDRRVAIKLLRRGPGAPADPGALLREARGLARVAHPNVVAVHDVGTLGGRVWLAMELVEGVTLRRWLDERPRPHREILEVFDAAGQGLAAAHAAGLVHRDFKPENVLIGADGRVRVTDFGLVAPADGGAGPGAPVAGTPRYMAPEQLLGEPADPRADQFSFCVALWEALLGHPFAAGDAAETRRRLLAGERNPPARDRDAPAWLRDVVARGLARQPGDRHASMAALLAELRRDPTRSRRRKITAAAALAGVALAAVALLRLAPGRDDPAASCRRGGERVHQAWSPPREVALRAAFAATRRPYAADTADRTTAALDVYARDWSAMHAEACAATHERREQTADLLDRRMLCLERRRGELEALAAVLAAADGDAVDRAVAAALGLPAIADCADSAHLLARAAPPADPARRGLLAVVDQQIARAAALDRAGRFTEGVAVARAAVDAARPLAYPPIEAEAQFRLGWLADEVGDPAGAEKAYREALRAAAAAGDDRLIAEYFTELARVVGLRRARPDQGLQVADAADVALVRAGEPARERALWLQVRGVILAERGDYDDARRALDGSVAALERLGDPLELARSLNRLGLVLITLGRHAEAEERFRRALDLREQVLGPAHPEVGQTLNNLCNLQHRQGRTAEARATCGRALALLRAAHGEQHRDVAIALGGIAGAAAGEGRFAEAVAGFRAALAIQEKVLGPLHPDTGVTLNNLANHLCDLGDFTEARRTYERALEVFRVTRGPGHYQVAMVENNIGELLLRREDKLAEAGDRLRRALAIDEAALGPEHWRTASPLVNLGDLALRQHRPAEAAGRYQRALAILEKSRGKDHPRVAAPLTGLGNVALAQGRPRDALLLLERALRLAEPDASDREGLAMTRFALARALWAGGTDRRRALELARRARRDFAATGLSRYLAETDAWLAAR